MTGLKRYTCSNGIENKFFVLLLLYFAGAYLSATGVLFGKSSFEIYGGYQTSPHSVVSGHHVEENVTFPFDFTAGWIGKSFSMPPYYGYRFTSWSERSGWGLDFTHAKVYADELTLNETGLKVLEFTDGLNNLTVHRQHLFGEPVNVFTPYFGYGVGVILPHVEFQSSERAPLTFGYQFGGPTLALNGGVRYPLTGGRFLFSEYKFTASWLNVDLAGGGTLKTLILTNALNLGFGFVF